MLKKLNQLRGRFPRVFWIVQIFELMERGAYYTMIPIIAVHAYFNVGIQKELAFTLTVFMYPIQYGLPIFSGAYAEKGGYKRQMILAFSILTVSYLILSFAFNSVTLIISVMLIGLGIGTYKPLISATVAKSTIQKDRTMAYSIYYMIVNIAAALFPILWVILEFSGVMNYSLYSWVFRIGSIFFIINLIVVIFFFKEVPRSGNVKTVQDVVNNIKIAFADKKFLVMVVLVGLFWALYSTFLNVLPMVLIGFRLVPVWFTAMLIGVFNPATIIIAGPFLVKLSERIESIRWLIGGILFYTVGLAIIGFSLQWVLVIFGIVIASIGEFMVAPGYLAFVSKLAPKDKVSSYIGCNFLATMLGITLGTLVFGLMASYIAVDLRMPNFTYGILISIALLLMVAFVMYYRTWGQDIIERAKKIRLMEEEYDEEYETALYKEPSFFKIFDNKFTTIIPIILVPIILVVTFSMGTKVFYEELVDGDGEEIKPVFEEVVMETSTTGSTDENSQSDVTFEVSKENYRLTKVGCRLTWQDESSSFFQGTNEPDNFQVSIMNPNGDTIAESSMETSGSITIDTELNYTIEDFKEQYTGEWRILIEAGDCGDDYARFGVRSTPDTGNDWSLEYSYTYLQEVEKE
jgi:MFS family permease